MVIFFITLNIVEKYLILIVHVSELQSGVLRLSLNFLSVYICKYINKY